MKIAAPCATVMLLDLSNATSPVGIGSLPVPGPTSSIGGTIERVLFGIDDQGIQ
ncbi:hypothetical protein RCH09_001955 [Actimicrobium sp. GrIS 1.19]|uniref:hypothetical protein n=1 Tax=Actimicrobium sp. GrIS 1.19 TaxID=3071708 RepID=UPI002E07B4EF|nr:hypothetical protein [Actimicrobium sp. GrIS 1.19]